MFVMQFEIWAAHFHNQIYSSCRRKCYGKSKKEMKLLGKNIIWKENGIDENMDDVSSATGTDDTGDGVVAVTKYIWQILMRYGLHLADELNRMYHNVVGSVAANTLKK